MAIKIFSWRYNIRLFIGTVLILGFIPGSVHAFSDEPTPPPNIISDEPPPTPETENKDPDQETETPTIPPIRPAENNLPPNNDLPGDTTGELPGEQETTDGVVPTPTIEAVPDINQPNFLETPAETEGETAVEIPEEPGQEPTPTTTGETPGEGGPSTSGPAINPPIEPPSGEGGFSEAVIDTVFPTGIDIPPQSPSTLDFGSSGGDLGAEGGVGVPTAQNIENILTGSSIDSANLNALVQGLLQILGSPSRDIAEHLVRSLLGLLKDGKVDPRRLWAAINAYNAFIEASSPEFLQNPPIELVMIRAILSDLVEAAIAADIRSRNY